MIGSIIGGALALGSSIYGGIKANKSMKDVKENIAKQQRENDDWYNRRYNEDATQRADAQRILTMTQENIKNRNKAAAGRAAVMGSTDEGVAAAKAANNEALADATSRIAASGEARKDNIEQQHQARKDALTAQENQMATQKAQNIATAANAAGTALADAGYSTDEYLLSLARKA